MGVGGIELVKKVTLYWKAVLPLLFIVELLLIYCFRTSRWRLWPPTSTTLPLAAAAAAGPTASTSTSAGIWAGGSTTPTASAPTGIEIRSSRGSTTRKRRAESGKESRTFTPRISKSLDTDPSTRREGGRKEQSQYLKITIEQQMKLC